MTARGGSARGRDAGNKRCESRAGAHTKVGIKGGGWVGGEGGKGVRARGESRAAAVTGERRGVGGSNSITSPHLPHLAELGSSAGPAGPAAGPAQWPERQHVRHPSQRSPRATKSYVSSNPRNSCHIACSSYSNVEVHRTLLHGGVGAGRGAAVHRRDKPGGGMGAATATQGRECRCRG